MSDNHSPVVHTRALTKTYRRFDKQPGLMGGVKSLFNRKYIYRTAVSSFDLDIAPGEFVGLIGPNGAGKTTLVKMLTGIIAPTSGEISVLGFIPNKLEDGLKRRCAVVMGQKSQLFFELTAEDTFRLFQSLYSIPEAEYRRSLDMFVEMFGVGHLTRAQVRTLSLGERMKMELIAALLHNPGVLFLDEPTIGLDAVAQRQTRQFLQDVNRERGTTILLTSHYMEDILKLCPRVVLINDGRKRFDGPTDRLFESYKAGMDEDIGSVVERIYSDNPDSSGNSSNSGNQGNLGNSDNSSNLGNPDDSGNSGNSGNPYNQDNPYNPEGGRLP
ncbi:MAG: ATP-binding cassette domain-containing protein [Oscillospiraceae bacterium]|jgi:ABC-2 type transport system ATP-binding protein|nr:ATP-binding cassette domain-containing protein [Oscillospiraceae bacterium]